MLNQQQRKLLLYPFKIIKYNLCPKDVFLEFSGFAKPYFETRLKIARIARADLKLPLDNTSILKEYKKWVDSIEIEKIVSAEQQNDIFLELKQSKQIQSYLYQVFKNNINQEYYTGRLIKSDVELSNPLINYHIDNYAELQNSHRESLKNYYLPKFWSDL